MKFSKCLPGKQHEIFSTFFALIGIMLSGMNGDKLVDTTDLANRISGRA